MIQSILKRTTRNVHAVLVASASFAVAAALSTSAPAYAASEDYRFDVVQVAQAGSGKSDVIIGLVRAADGTVVTDAELAMNSAVGSASERPGYRRFRIETPAPGSQSLQVVATVPGPTRIERTFNSSVKFLQTRTVRGPDRVITGTAAIAAN